MSYEHSQAAIHNSVNTNLRVATENTGKAINNWMDARKDDIRIISAIAENSEEGKFRKYLNSLRYWINNNGGIYVISGVNSGGSALIVRADSDIRSILMTLMARQ